METCNSVSTFSLFKLDENEMQEAEQPITFFCRVFAHVGNISSRWFASAD